MKINQSVFGNFWKILQGFFLEIEQNPTKMKSGWKFSNLERTSWIDFRSLKNVRLVRLKSETLKTLDEHFLQLRSFSFSKKETIRIHWKLCTFFKSFLIIHQIRFIRFEKNYNSKNIRKIDTKWYVYLIFNTTISYTSWYV